MDRVSVPLWGTFLSEPLLIVALVGRYPANKLIRREAISERYNLWQSIPCDITASCGINPAFAGLSPTHGQVTYALLTRAPVAGRIAPPLPLDLHVLGLSLAFILSQDQTLRCKYRL